MPQHPASTTTDLTGKVYSPVGRCIYCGGTGDLTNEHILPFGLSGTALLPKASCRACARITGDVEQKLLRGSFWPVRVFRDLKSRTKHRDAPASYPVTLLHGEREELVELPLDHVPILLPFPHFALPTHLSGAPPVHGITVTRMPAVLFGSRRPEDVAREMGATGIRLHRQERPAWFARMVAKIGYAFAWAEGAIHDVELPAPIVPAILGHSEDIGAWLGTLDKPYESHPGVLHRLELAYDLERRLLFAEVQLFADSQTPSYGVILGSLKGRGD